MDIGTPCRETVSFIYNLVMVSILFVALVRMKCADLNSYVILPSISALYNDSDQRLTFIHLQSCWTHMRLLQLLTTSSDEYKLLQFSLQESNEFYQEDFVDLMVGKLCELEFKETSLFALFYYRKQNRLHCPDAVLK
ncbi:hypothetical protein Tco_1029099 [Tanacetum coccineum]|uniref:Uncharacterized protein n=1 Tax=Tanacetum coccineum TaxID=301880 RepID=A0ABQ5G3Q6_9ASTR